MMMNIEVGSGLEDSKCVPYVSQYTDCTDANACSGCTRCNCNEKGNWECRNVLECPQEEGTSVVDDDILENALDNLNEELENKRRGPGSLVPSPPNPNDDLLLVSDKRAQLDKQIKMLLDGRQKRSVPEDKHNATVKFYETVDEINEDTLRGLNSTGTIEAHKFHAREVGKISRRTEVPENKNASDSNLHIKYSKPHELEHHIAENKVDSKHPTEDTINGLTHEEIHKILGNYSQIIKNNELSKLVVNELTRGSERIGDKNVVPVSNITFTPENDTLTAMTFIAGNLLNKLWDMEKDASEGSYETEIMKHEKINDLLELFREPLSLRQENFLKNALEKLSRVIDGNKDIKNMSLCANIEEKSETIETVNNNCTEKSKMLNERDLSAEDIKMKRAGSENKIRANAISKIDEVLNLMKKYEQLQNKLYDMKNIPQLDLKNPTVAAEKNMSVSEDISLNLFGKVLDKVTKLLSPNKNSKGISKRLGTYNMLRKDNIAKKNLEKMFNINLDSVTLGAKDRMITDYLSTIEKHPNCFFTHLQKPVVTPLSNVEGSILYNLSEFFKIKSITDLLNVVSDKEDNPVKLLNTTSEIKTSYSTTPKQNKATIPILRINPKSKDGSSESAKEKLKNDIKIILQDLYDLQKEHGVKNKSNINIADVLPCIYNILNADTKNKNEDSESKAISSFSNKLSAFLNSLKQDMKFMSLNRRSNTNVSPRPKSAVVWERTIKHLNTKYQKSSRRLLDEIPKTLKELRVMMDKVELSSNTYKNFAVKLGVAPSERLIFLKTLEADVKQYIKVLEAIRNSFTTIKKLPTEKQNEFLEFMDNAAMNINLNNKLIDLVSKLKAKRSENRKSNIINDTNDNQPLMMIPRWGEENENNNFRLNRDQILTQLIKNRLRLYIKTKERSEFDLTANANYNIAKRILYHLETGNIGLAKELYKVFLENKQRHTSRGLSEFTEYRDKASFEINESPDSTKLKLPLFKEPLIRDEEARKIKMLTQDYFLRQLWNLKELKE